jgi:hypothetical protein
LRYLVCLVNGKACIPVEFLQYLADLGRSFRVEVSGRLVGKG